MKRNKGGRPRGSTKHRRPNAIIGQTCEILAWWGFPRRRIYRAVSAAAEAADLRTGPHGYKLKPARVEQLHEAFQEEQARLRAWRDKRSRYTTRTLRQRCPDYSLSVIQWAALLIRAGGQYTEPPGTPLVPHGDPELAPKANAVYLRNRLTLAR